jgi:serine/threonine protein kinase
MSIGRGTRVGAYEFLEPLGSGGMGSVYRARDLRLERLVAVKIVAEDVTPQLDHRERFRREAQSLATLNHPNIAHIYGVEDTEYGVAIVIELVEGPTLAEMLSTGPLAAGRLAVIAEQLTSALCHASGRVLFIAISNRQKISSARGRHSQGPRLWARKAPSHHRRYGQHADAVDSWHSAWRDRRHAWLHVA